MKLSKEQIQETIFLYKEALIDIDEEEVYEKYNEIIKILEHMLANAD